MQHLKVSGSVRHIYLYAIRRLKFNHELQFIHTFFLLFLPFTMIVNDRRTVLQIRWEVAKEQSHSVHKQLYSGTHRVLTFKATKQMCTELGRIFLYHETLHFFRIDLHVNTIAQVHLVPIEPLISVAICKQGREITRTLPLCFPLTWFIILVQLINLFRVISTTKFNAQFSLFIKNMFVTLLSSTCFEH